MSLSNLKTLYPFLALLVLPSVAGLAQFREDFNQSVPEFGAKAIPGWNAITGDGEGIFTQRVQDGVATLRLDARPDKRNIWYAFIHRDATPALDLKKLNQPGYALRIEARVKPSRGPRRVNLFLKSLATGDEFLREFDLPQADQWYEISMTTGDFRHAAGKMLVAQVSYMDWGNTGVYDLDVDYLKVDVVKRSRAEPDKGLPLVYRPPLADAGTFAVERPVKADATVDRQYPDLNVSRLAVNGDTAAPLRMVDGTKITLLQWDLSDLKGKKAKGPGQLEFYTHTVYRLAENPKDFGEVRICEITGGNPGWSPQEVTFASFLNGSPEAAVINEQTIVDVAVTPGQGGKTTVTLSQPVMQRLLDGKTTGIAIRPLGLIDAVLYGAGDGRYAPRLRLNVEE